jgi:hypothetical protein
MPEDIRDTLERPGSSLHAGDTGTHKATTRTPPRNLYTIAAQGTGRANNVSIYYSVIAVLIRFDDLIRRITLRASRSRRSINRLIPLSDASRLGGTVFSETNDARRFSSCDISARNLRVRWLVLRSGIAGTFRKSIELCSLACVPRWPQSYMSLGKQRALGVPRSLRSFPREAPARRLVQSNDKLRPSKLGRSNLESKMNAMVWAARQGAGHPAVNVRHYFEAPK